MTREDSSSLTPPPAPWRLTGEAFVALSRPPVTAIQHRLPDLVRPVAMGGRALCVLYWARYDQRSTLQYHELIVATLVRRGWRWGGWIPLIYVDLMTSLVGGRKLWHLPKELAEFAWSPDQVRVSTADMPLCSMKYQPGGAVKVPLFAPVLTSMNGALARFHVRGSAKVRRTAVAIEVPHNSPLRPFDFHGCTSVFSLSELDGTISAPRL